MRRAAVWALLLVVVLAGAVAAGGPGRAGAAPSAITLFTSTTRSTTTTSTTVASTTSSSSSTSAPADTSSTTVAHPSTTVPGSGTTTPPTAPSSPYAAGFVPCSSTPAAGTCDEPPRQLQVMYKAGRPAAALELVWVAKGRPAAAPVPAHPTAVLAWSAGTDCGSDLRCWPWPAAVTDRSFVLNGTYQLVPCAADDNGSCGAPYPAQPVALAVPAGAPTDVRAASSGPRVTLSWQPPAAAPPDLAGYGVSRDGRTVYECSTDGLGPGRAVPCPRSLAVTDSPPDGKHAYAVAAFRLGADGGAGGRVLTSALAPAGGAVTVPGPLNGGGAGFAPSPVIGSVGVIPEGPAATMLPPLSPSVPPGNLPGEDGSAGGGPVQNLQYPGDDPAVAGSSALAVHLTGTSRPDVVPAAVIAMAILALAVAAHFLYLRMQVGLIQARQGKVNGNERDP